MISSGETPIETSTADAETLLTVPAGVTVRNVSIVNEGDAAGFFSDDGGETWGRLPGRSRLRSTCLTQKAGAARSRSSATKTRAALTYPACTPSHGKHSETEQTEGARLGNRKRHRVVRESRACPCS
jgi:hypothetical protein